jgi:hypothetical protein
VASSPHITVLLLLFKRSHTIFGVNIVFGEHFPPRDIIWNDVLFRHIKRVSSCFRSSQALGPGTSMALSFVVFWNSTTFHTRRPLLKCTPLRSGRGGVVHVFQDTVHAPRKLAFLRSSAQGESCPGSGTLFWSTPWSELLFILEKEGNG